jgi:hypothetical protein
MKAGSPSLSEPLLPVAPNTTAIRAPKATAIMQT